MVGGTGFTGCVSSTNVVVYVASAISLTTSASSTLSCSGAPVLITVSGASTYTWVNNGITTNTISVTPTVATTYTVNGESGGCIGTKTISISIAANPNVLAVTSNTLLCSGQSANLTASVSPFSPGMTYTWSTGQTLTTISVSPTTTTTYTVVGKNINGCTNTAVVTQSVSSCTGIENISNTINYLNVYPNPNNGEFTITTTKGIYNIINTIGAVVKTIEVENDNELVEIKDLSQGIYYIIGKTAKAKIIIAK